MCIPNDDDIAMLELAEASRWYYCSQCGDDNHRRKRPADNEGRCPDCQESPE